MFRRHLVFLAILLALSVQVVFSATVAINRGDNANGDNDEPSTAPPPAEPPIHHQFAVVSTKLTSPLKKKPLSQPKPEEKVAEDTDDGEGDGDIDEGFPGEGRKLGVHGKKRVKQTPAFQGAAACGYYRMRPGQAYSIQSTNYNSGGTYRNFEQCTWRFFGQQCRVKAACPCFDLPTSPDCTGDLLKVTDLYSFAHKFCGDLAPQGIYNSTTNNLKIHFRADGQSTNEVGQGFRCYVTCTGYGKPDPAQLTTGTAMCAFGRAVKK